MAEDIRYKFKMNCIRLTFSLQLIYDNNIVPEKYLKANPDLIGKTSMEIFDIEELLFFPMYKGSTNTKY